MPDVYAKENLFKLEGAFEVGDDAVLTANTIAADQNDYNPTDGVDNFNDAGVVTVFGVGLDSNGNNNITGLLAPNPAKRVMVYVVNVGTTGDNITLSSNDIGSQAANRFDFNGDTTLNAKEGIWLVYNVATSRWNEIARAI